MSKTSTKVTATPFQSQSGDASADSTEYLLFLLISLLLLLFISGCKGHRSQKQSVRPQRSSPHANSHFPQTASSAHSHFLRLRFLRSAAATTPFQPAASIRFHLALLRYHPLPVSVSLYIPASTVTGGGRRDRGRKDEEEERKKEGRQKGTSKG